MKAILISIKPQWIAKILNGEKAIEVRKRFPVDYVGWVYIYCTKDRPYLTRGVRGDVYPSCVSSQGIVPHHLNSRVVARFWCDKVEKIRSYLEPEQWYMTSDLGGSGLLQKSCLSFEELDDYLLSSEGYAIHITKLEIFDKPKELSEFSVKVFPRRKDNLMIRYLTRAPQSFCFIEV